MLTKTQVLGVVIGLVRVGDSHLLLDDECLPGEICISEDRDTLRRMAVLIRDIRRGYRYLESPEFLDAINTKGAAYRSMRTRLEDEPIKRKKHLARLEESLVAILSSPEAFRLVPPRLQGLIRELKELAQTLSNPYDQ